MRGWRRLAIIGLAGAALIGCAAQMAGVPPAQLLAQLQTGQAVLNCRETCLGTWTLKQPTAAQLEAAGQWSNLAVLVMQVGYDEDLSYYYLGRSAEGLGYLTAAQKYYQSSIQLSATAYACRYALATQYGLANACGGVVLPAAVYPHLAAIDARLAPPPYEPSQRVRYRRVQHPPSAATPASASAPAGEAPAAGFVEPAPTAAPSSAGGGFAEPPPAHQ